MKINERKRIDFTTIRWFRTCTKDRCDHKGNVQAS